MKERDIIRMVRLLKEEINAKYSHEKHIREEVCESIDKFFPIVEHKI